MIETNPFDRFITIVFGSSTKTQFNHETNVNINSVILMNCGQNISYATLTYIRHDVPFFSSNRQRRISCE
jgi:hypothetical protein